MRSRTVLGAAASLCVLLGAAACGGDDGESEADLIGGISEALQAGDEGLDVETADCVAEIVVDEGGVEELQDVDLSADEPPPELQEAIAAATVRGAQECQQTEPG